MQINVTQYVLVRIPRNMGLFDKEYIEPDEQTGKDLNEKLLDKEKGNDDDDCKKQSDVTPKED